MEIYLIYLNNRTDLDVASEDSVRGDEGIVGNARALRVVEAHLEVHELFSLIIYIFKN